MYVNAFYIHSISYNEIGINEVIKKKLVAPLFVTLQLFN